MSQSYNVIIDRGVSAPVHVIYVVDGLNLTDKRFFFQLMETVKVTNSKGHDMQMVMHSANSTRDVSLERRFQK